MLGGVPVGGDSPVSIQTMCNTHTSDANATLAQIRRTAQLGCDITRVAVPDEASLAGLKEIVKKSPLPVVADIHFDYRLALGAIEAGAPGIRINPGNIGSEDAVRQVAEAARKHGTVIRVGANSGSLAKSYRLKLAAADGARRTEILAEALAQSAREQC
ncbi:MAG: flavodoxin-dependent (E)-4-hydroxy-3-methylbut-2-enyl-diphosphate synthase, partial [Victivallaceae bacterium]|nr:flavodoxin-dependent (E)-4-hydroxy-3-methylbut-2-enyl-diphosphate synthase [Victivallaceae bacterium]